MKNYSFFSHYKRFPKTELFYVYFDFLHPNLNVIFIDMPDKKKIKCKIKSNNESDLNIFKKEIQKLDTLKESEHATIFTSDIVKYCVCHSYKDTLSMSILNNKNKLSCKELPASCDRDIVYYNKDKDMKYYDDGKFIGTLEPQLKESLYDCLDRSGNKYHRFANNDDYIHFIKLNIFK